MSAITSDWALTETETPNRQEVKSRNGYRREEEFRSALDSYIGEYRKHRAATIGSAGCGTSNTHFTLFRSLAGWIRR